MYVTSGQLKINEQTDRTMEINKGTICYWQENIRNQYLGVVMRHPFVIFTVYICVN